MALVGMFLRQEIGSREIRIGHRLGMKRRLYWPEGDQYI
tara:strand:- start:502 stop:618 length:117 start_codon:yes stop_codon:yes gene_type:complete